MVAIVGELPASSSSLPFQGNLLLTSSFVDSYDEVGQSKGMEKRVAVWNSYVLDAIGSEKKEERNPVTGRR